MAWTKLVASDYRRDFALTVELYEDDEHRATIMGTPSGELVLQIYPSEKGRFDIPARWLLSFMQEELDAIERADKIGVDDMKEDGSPDSRDGDGGTPGIAGPDHHISGGQDDRGVRPTDCKVWVQ